MAILERDFVIWGGREMKGGREGERGGRERGEGERGWRERGEGERERGEGERERGEGEEGGEGERGGREVYNTCKSVLTKPCCLLKYS